MEGVNFSGTNAVLSNLTGAINFSGANLSSVSFQNSDLSNAIYINTVFSQIDPNSGERSNVNLSGTNAMLTLSGAVDLIGVNLSGVNLFNSDLTTAQLTDAKFDNSTVWPTGFDPVVAGAVNIDSNSGSNGNTDPIDDNNTVFVVSGGNAEAPFYNFSFESNGSTVDFSNYGLTRGNTYIFKATSISASHPFNIGEAFQVTSTHVSGGPLDQNSGTNNQSITVTIPSDYTGTLAYFCTVHSTMVSEFSLLSSDSTGSEPGTNTDTDTGTGDSNTFALDTTTSGPGGDTGTSDSNTFTLDTTSSGPGGDTGTGDSNTFALDTTSTGTGGDTGTGIPTHSH